MSRALAFRGSNAAASLKRRCRGGWGIICHRAFRGSNAAASLKRVEAEGVPRLNAEGLPRQ